MTRDQILAALSDVDALTATLLGECANEPIEGQVAVGSVIRTRALMDLGNDGKPDWWGEGIKGICLAKSQFSCWWERNQNTDRVYALAQALIEQQPAGEAGSVVAQLQWVAEGIVSGVIRDNVKAADHYLTKALYDSSKAPEWARRPVIKAVGHHVFFKLN